MKNHRAAVRQVSEDSFLILVDGDPVFQTTDESVARQMANRLMRLFRGPRLLESFIVRGAEGRYDVRGRLTTSREDARTVTETVLLELADEQTPFSWLQASVVAENLRRILQRGEEHLRQPAPLPDVVPFTPTPHKPIAQPSTTVLNPKNPSPEEHLPQLGTVLQRVPTELGTVILYTKLHDRRNVHAGFVTEERSFDLSPISDWLTWPLTTVAVVRLLKEPIPFLRLQGIVGANTMRNLYFRMVEGVPVPLLDMDGNSYEIDLNNDGDKEVIITTGTPPLTIVFLWADGHYEEVNVNLTLKRKSTQLNLDTQLIDVYETQPDMEAPSEEPQVSSFKIKEHTFVRVPAPTAPQEAAPAAAPETPPSAPEPPANAPQPPASAT